MLALFIELNQSGQGQIFTPSVGADNIHFALHNDVVSCTYGVHRSLYSLATVSMPPALATAT